MNPVASLVSTAVRIFVPIPRRWREMATENPVEICKSQEVIVKNRTCCRRPTCDEHQVTRGHWCHWGSLAVTGGVTASAVEGSLGVIARNRRADSSIQCICDAALLRLPALSPLIFVLPHPQHTLGLSSFLCCSFVLEVPRLMLSQYQ